MFLLRYALSLLLLLALGSSRPPKPAPIRWVAPQALADSLRVRPRPVLVFVHTTWCRYCKLQELSTFRNPDVVRRLNAGYYAVALDAESRAPIAFGGKTYQFQATGPDTGIHALALLLARDEHGQTAYPTTVLLDQQLRVRGRWTGLLKPTGLLAALTQQARETAPVPGR
ncbi:hypothetical protein BEN47_16455 [Hymenobacter lapidarius]|uniref:Thioredoxin-like fold domain-containing protein n=1 Tax=Hymenobacter lapidarius TaxID=1908237 RepID=A0A1G1T053_9BACT|nr:thioredoxin family protein [Hymenobacter lapidarius]OGX84245.1 hypothetical protein BEN47_16455 [Hymenobacter lapidarius]